MSQFLGTLDARQPNNQTTLLDDSWFIRSGRVDMSPRRRGDSQFGARARFFTLWPASSFMSGDRSPGYCYSNQDAGVYGAWSPTQKASRGNGSTKFIKGVCKDSNNNTVSGAIVQGFITSTDIYVGETTCDSNGNYELGTVYPATQHYLVAYRAGSPDIAGTTVNTLTPTNRDGT